MRRHDLLRVVLSKHQRMERDKCSCGRGWLPDAYNYVDHVVAVYQEALDGTLR